MCGAKRNEPLTLAAMAAGAKGGEEGEEGEKDEEDAAEKAAAAAAAGEEEWTCTACTMANKGSFLACVACETKKPGVQSKRIWMYENPSSGTWSTYDEDSL